MAIDQKWDDHVDISEFSAELDPKPLEEALAPETEAKADYSKQAVNSKLREATKLNNLLLELAPNLALQATHEGLDHLRASLNQDAQAEVTPGMAKIRSEIEPLLPPTQEELESSLENYHKLDTLETELITMHEQLLEQRENEPEIANKILAEQKEAVSKQIAELEKMLKENFDKKGFNSQEILANIEQKRGYLKDLEEKPQDYLIEPSESLQKSIEEIAGELEAISAQLEIQILTDTHLDFEAHPERACRDDYEETLCKDNSSKFIRVLKANPGRYALEAAQAFTSALEDKLASVYMEMKNSARAAITDNNIGEATKLLKTADKIKSVFPGVEDRNVTSRGEADEIDYAKGRNLDVEAGSFLPGIRDNNPYNKYLNNTAGLQLFRRYGIPFDGSPLAHSLGLNNPSNPLDFKSLLKRSRRESPVSQTDLTTEDVANLTGQSSGKCEELTENSVKLNLWGETPLGKFAIKLVRSISDIKESDIVIKIRSARNSAATWFAEKLENILPEQITQSHDHEDSEKYYIVTEKLAEDKDKGTTEENTSDSPK